MISRLKTIPVTIALLESAPKASANLQLNSTSILSFILVIHRHPQTPNGRNSKIPPLRFNRNKTPTQMRSWEETHQLPKMSRLSVSSLWAPQDLVKEIARLFQRYIPKLLLKQRIKQLHSSKPKNLPISLMVSASLPILAFAKGKTLSSLDASTLTPSI